MPRKTIRDVIPISRGFRSSEGAVFIAEMNELTERMWRDLRGMTPRQLAWQPAPGRNSIGMLLAHCAIVETAWIGGPARGQSPVDFPKLIGVGPDDDGLPALPNGRHPRALRGKSLAWYRKLLERSRRFITREVKRMTPRDIDRVRERMWRSQNARHVFNLRWILFHVLEHLGGHYGQILLLKELMKSPRAKRGRR